MMNSETEQLSVRLMAAVEAAMNPQTPHQQRLEAYQACEEFKETSPNCALCGVLLASKEQNHIVRHFGLQLLEHCVKYRWNTMDPKEKLFINENTMKLLKEGTLDMLEEQLHIKDALSRIVVEMIKREWPQQWPNLMQELHTMCLLGPTQAELVLMVFLRLAEDVLHFQSVPFQRKREIMQGLTENMPSLFAYFMDTLQTGYSNYKDKMFMQDELVRRQGMMACRVVTSVLNTLAAFLDWINMSFIAENNGLLLELLTAMLSDNNLQLAAAECLLVVTSRKQKLEERKPLLILFREAPMLAILNAAVLASNADLEEHHYLFLKRMCQVLTAVGNQLCALWGFCEGVSRPPNFEQYLKAILAFTTHPSQTLGSITQTLWVAFLRHDHISVDPVFQATVPSLIDSTRSALVKVGFPSQANSRSCAYARLDFDSDGDFHVFLSKYRAEVADTIRHATLTNPEITFPFAAKWLQEQLHKPLDIGEFTSRNHCNQSSPAFLEWDALTVCLEGVMTRFHQTEKPKPPVTEGVQLLRDVLAFQSQDPLILSSLLSCISALFSFITFAPDILPCVLDKIFDSAVFNLEGQTKSTRSKAVKNVRRHACSVLVKLCKQYPDLLLPGFDQLHMHIKQLSSDPTELSQMEKITLIEALILISNRFQNFDKQCSFLRDVMAPVRETWLSAEMKESLWSADKFLSYVGLDQPPVEPSSEDTCGINRSQIHTSVNIILAVLKRSAWPEDIEAAKAGGFVMGRSETGGYILRNPCTALLQGMLDNIMALCRTLNLLWSPELLAKRHPEFSKSYDMQDSDKQVLLGIQPPCVDNTDVTSCKHPLERMQSFITNTHQSSFHVLGNAGLSMGHDFYQVPNLANMLLQFMFTNLDVIPAFKVRPIIRVFLKPYVQACPKEYYENAVLPILSFFCSDMLQRLKKEWAILAERATVKIEEEDEESQEVIDELVIRQMTREYLDFIGVLLGRRRLGPGSEENATEEDMPTNINKDEDIDDLGCLTLCSDEVYPSIVIVVFAALGWHDSKACCQSAVMAWRIASKLVEEKKLTNEDICHLFQNILVGLQVNGQHENCMSALLSLTLHFYENLRPKYADLSKILLQLPGVTDKDVEKFDKKILHNQNVKSAKDNLKKILQGIIGKNIGQQFKREEHIKNLPPLLRAQKPQPASLLSPESTEVIDLCALFKPSDES